MITISFNIPKIGNGIVLLIRVGESIRLKWVKANTYLYISRYSKDLPKSLRLRIHLR